MTQSYNPAASDFDRVHRECLDLIERFGFMTQAVDGVYSYTVSKEGKDCLVVPLAMGSLPHAIFTEVFGKDMGAFIKPFTIPELKIRGTEEFIRLRFVKVDDPQLIDTFVNNALFTYLRLKQDLPKVLYVLQVADAENRLPGEEGYNFLDQSIEASLMRIGSRKGTA